MVEQICWNHYWFNTNRRLLLHIHVHSWKMTAGIIDLTVNMWLVYSHTKNVSYFQDISLCLQLHSWKMTWSESFTIEGWLHLSRPNELVELQVLELKVTLFDLTDKTELFKLNVSHIKSFRVNHLIERKRPTNWTGLIASFETYNDWLFDTPPASMEQFKTRIRYAQYFTFYAHSEQHHWLVRKHWSVFYQRWFSVLTVQRDWSAFEGVLGAVHARRRAVTGAQCWHLAASPSW